MAKPQKPADEGKEPSQTRVTQRSKLDHELSIREFPWSDKQKQFIQAMDDKNTKVIFVDGCAGTGKTLLSVYCALRLLNRKRVGELFYIRTTAESASKGLGFLPGEASEKFAPFMMPLFDKLDELLQKKEKDALIKENRVRGIPVNFLRGASLNCSCVLFDEIQNATKAELTTMITRIGAFSKFIFLGDSRQSDIGSRSYFKEFIKSFDDEACRERGIFVYRFDADDIVRSDILKFIMLRLESEMRPS